MNKMSDTNRTQQTANKYKYGCKIGCLITKVNPKLLRVMNIEKYRNDFTVFIKDVLAVIKIMKPIA
jgi:hypothetical protein